MRNEANPRVSVIVPIYNVERYLDQALDSIETQTLHDIEILCVNDGSTDASPDIVERHAQRDERVRLIGKPNGGYGSACNRGLEEARGAWIAIVEPDDWIEPTMYEDMLTHVESLGCPIDIVKTPYWRVIDPDTPDQRMLNCSYKGRIKPARQPFTITDKGVDHLLIHHPSIWSALYRTEFLREKGIRFLEIPGAGWADNPFLVETLCQASAIAYLDRAYYCYREETEEKSAAFARRSLTIPFERWHDMMDVLERLNVRSELVLRPQYRRGFTYLDYIAEEIETCDPRVQTIMPAMFNRMDPELVMSDPDIAPTWKKRFQEARGLEGGFVNPLPYARSLIGAGLYSLKNIGPAETLKVVGAVAQHNKTASDTTVQTQVESVAVLAPASSPAGSDTGVEPSLSVIVPVYNAAPYLGDCLSSLANQTRKPLEVICVDDGSSDNSCEIIEQWTANDLNIRIVHKENGGPSSARNVGIREAAGDYVCFLDADDAFEPTACQRMMEEARARACDCIVFGWSCFPQEQANEWLIERTNVRDAYYSHFEPELVFEEMTNPFLRLAVRRKLLIEKEVFFDEEFRVGEDSAFLFALYPRAQATRLISDKLYRYRMPHAGSITSTSRDGTPEKCADDLLMMVSIFEDWDRAGFLELYGAELVHWLISFWLYTVLRQPASLRDPLVQATKELLLAHFTIGELMNLAVPVHDFKLIAVVLSSHDGALNMSERDLSRALFAWRNAEYGILDLARTALNRLRPKK